MATEDGTESSLIHDLTGLQDSRSTAGFLEIAFDAVVTFDLQESITSWNPAAERMYGWTSQEALGKTPAELFWPIDMPLGQENKRQRQARLMRGETLQGEISPCRKDGSTFPVQFAARAIFDSDGTPKGYLAVYRDISSQVQAREKEDQLQQSNHRLNQILESIQDDFYVLDHNWIFVFASRSFTRRIEKEPQDFVGNNIWEMFPKHIGSALEENFRAAMEKREIRRFEIPGKYTDAWYRMTAFPSEEGITVIGTDITERRRAEEILRENEHKFFLLFEKAGFAAALSELPDGTLVDVNEAWVKQFGYTKQEAAGKTTLELNINPDAQGRARLLAQIQEKGMAHNIEIRLRTRSGEWRDYLTNVDLIDIGDKKYIFNTVQDITERKRAEEEHQKADRRYHIVGEVIPFGVWEADTEGNATYLSPVFLQLTGQTLEEHRRSWETLVQAEGTDDLVRAWRECVQNGTPWDREFRILGKDGNFHAIHARGLPLYNSAGEITSYVGINFDITEHKRVEDALRENEKQLQLLNETLEQKVQEKTEEVRRLASDLTKAVQRERYRISHILHDDLQQRIYAIQMQLAFLRYELEAANEATQYELSEVEKQLAEVLELTRHLSIDLSPPILRDEGLSQAILWLAGQMRQRYGLPIDVQADEPFAIPDEELHVLLFNCVRELLFNIVKHAQASRAVIKLSWSDANLQIEVNDDGKGFPVKTVESRLGMEISGEDGFHPSFGLPTIRQQLSLFDGRIEIQSEPGIGTQITIIAPVAKAA